MATVRKLKGKWYLDYRDARGKRRRQRAGDGSSKRRAEVLLREKMLEVDRGGGADGRERFETYARRWLERKKHTVRWSSYLNYRTSVERYMLDPVRGLGDQELGRISKPAIEDWMLAIKSAHPKMANSTINRILNTLRNVLASALDDGALVVNTARRVRVLPTERRDVVVLAPEQLRHLFAVADQAGGPMPLAVRLAVYTGIRRGELLALRWKDLDLDRRRLTVLRSYGHGRFSSPKTAAGRRVVGLPSPLIPQLRRWRLQQGVRALVFDNGNGEPIDPRHLSKTLWGQVRAAAGLPGTFRWHDLRHTFASLLIANGESIKVVQAKMGHATIQVTLDLYAHLLPDEGEAVADRLAEMVGEVPAGCPVAVEQGGTREIDG